MIQMYGGQGMGTAGSGVNPGGQINPMQLMQMLQASGMGQPNTTTPMQPGSGATPMANYIGAPSMGAAAMHNQPGAVPPNPSVQMAQAQNQGSGANMQQMMQMLAAMKQGQSGVTPANGQPAGANPQWSNGWLQNLLQGYQGNGLPGQGVMQNLQNQAASNVNSGAPGM